MKKLSVLLTIVLLSVCGAKVYSAPNLEINFPVSAGINDLAVNFNVEVNDYTGYVYLAVGVTMPATISAPSVTIRNNTQISSTGVYKFYSGDFGDKGSGWSFLLDSSILPVNAGGKITVITGYKDGPSEYIITDLSQNSTCWAEYAYQLSSLTNLPKITNPTIGLSSLSQTSNTTLYYNAENMLVGDYFYCRILPAGIPLTNDRLPDITVTSAPRTEIAYDYTGSTFRVQYTGENTPLVINSNLRNRVQAYLDNEKVQSYQYSDGFVLQIIAVSSQGASSSKVLYYSWENDTDKYNAYVALAATNGNFVSGGSVNYLLDYHAVFKGLGVGNAGRIYVGLKSFKDVTNVAGALELESQEYTLNENLIYYIDLDSEGKMSYNLAHLLLEANEISIFVRAANSKTSTSLDAKSVERKYTFTSELVQMDARRPNNFVGTGTLTNTSIGYGWNIEQLDYLVNTIDVNQPFTIYLGTNYISEGNTWNGSVVPNVLIHDVANNAWSKIPSNLIMANQGATQPGIFGNSSYNNYFTVTIDKYFEIMGIAPANYISGGKIEIKIGSNNNTNEVTQRGTAINTFPLFAVNSSRINLNTTLTQGNTNRVSIFSATEEAEVNFSVYPISTKINDIEEYSRIYFVLGESGYIDLQNALPYIPNVTYLKEEITYYVKNNTLIDFNDFLSVNNSELIVRTRAVISNYQEAIKTWKYVRKIPVLDTDTWTIDLYYDQHDCISKNLEEILIDLGYLSRDASARSTAGFPKLMLNSDIGTPDNSLIAVKSNSPLTGFDWYMVDPYATKALNNNGETNGTPLDYAKGTIKIIGDKSYSYFQSRYQNPHKPWVNTEMLYKNFVGWNGQELIHTYFVMQSGGHTYTNLVHDVPKFNIKNAQPGNANLETGKYITVNVHVIPVEEPNFDWKQLSLEDYSNPSGETPSYFPGNENYNKPYPANSGVTNYPWGGTCNTTGRYGLADDNAYVIIKSMKNSNGSNIGTCCNGYTNGDWNYDLKAPNYNAQTNPNDYFNFVNANDKANGLFYSKEIDICTDIPLRFMAQFSNATTGLRNGGYGENYRIKPNIYLRILSGNATAAEQNLSTEELIAAGKGSLILGEDWTGDIEMTRGWEDVFLDFYPKKSDGSKIVVQFLNVEVGGLGNDFAIDNIQILAQEMRATVKKEFVSCEENEASTTQDALNNGYDLVFSLNKDDMDLLYYQSGLDGIATSRNYWYYVVPPVGDPFVSANPCIYNFKATDPKENDIVIRDPEGNRLTLYSGDYKVYIYITEDGKPMVEQFLSASCFPSVIFAYTPSNIQITSDRDDASVGLCAGETYTLTLSGLQEGEDGSLEWFYYNADGTIYPLRNYNASITVNPARTTKYGVHIPGCPSSVKTYEIIVNDIPYVNFGSKEYIQGSQETYTYRACYTEENLTKIIIPLQSASRDANGDKFSIYTKGTTEKPEYLEKYSVGTVDAVSGSTLGLTLYFKNKPVEENDFKGNNALNTPIHTLKLHISNNASTCTLDENFDIRYISPRSVWVGPASTDSNPSNNWNKDEYWKVFDNIEGDKAGNIIVYENSNAGIPMVCTDVIIPGGNKTGEAKRYPYIGYYPNLEISIADREIWDDAFHINPLCNTITFEMGGEIDKQHLLSYHKAFIEFNFGNYDGSKFQNMKPTSQLLNRERYYLISAPLQEMYAGDLFFGGKPNVYARYSESQPIIQKEEYERFGGIFTDSYSEISITRALPTYNIPLSVGNGFAFGVLGNTLIPQGPNSINPGNATAAVYDQTNIGSKGGIVKYPRFENEKWGSQVTDNAYGFPKATTGESYGFNQYESFKVNEDGSGTTAYRYFYAGKPDKVVPQNLAWEEVKRNIYVTPDYGRGEQAVYLGNRFIIDQTGKRMLPADQIRTYQENEQTKYYEVIIGNPYMAHLDFAKFYNHNNIAPHYRTFRNDNTYVTQYDEEGNFITSTDPEISAIKLEKGSTMGADLLSPLQAFFVEPLSTNMAINFDASMTTVRNIDSSMAENKNALRSRKVKDFFSLLLTISNSKGSGTTSLVLHEEDGELSGGVTKMFAGNTQIPEIFINQDDTYKSIAHYSKYATEIPLGIIHRGNDTDLTLRIDGIQQLGRNIGIKDRHSGKINTLYEGNNEYTIILNAGDPDRNIDLFDRYSIVLLENVSVGTDMNISNQQDIQVNAQNKKLYVSSSVEDPIVDVKIYNIQGQLLLHKKQIIQPKCTIPVHELFGIYVIQVETKNNKKTTKVLIN